MEQESESPLAEVWLQQAEPIILSILRRKLHASLDAHDPLERNQDALELLGDVRLRLIQKLAPHPTDNEAHSIQDFCRFAATVTYNACAEYFRQKFPRRTGLNNSLRYFLTHVPTYALWDVGDGTMCCGFADWRHLSAQALDDAYMTRLQRASQTLDAETLPAKAVEWFRREDWDRLIHTIFDHLQTPSSLRRSPCVGG